MDMFQLTTVSSMPTASPSHRSSGARLAAQLGQRLGRAERVAGVLRRKRCRKVRQQRLIQRLCAQRVVPGRVHHLKLAARGQAHGVTPDDADAEVRHEHNTAAPRARPQYWQL